MVYAPVIIPTLNRADHLKRCLESLGRNTGAEYTEVFISVDYPPAEKYVEGYEKVKKLLDQMDFSCFHKVNVIFQKENLGARKNCEFLYDVIAEKYDRYILSEDDNEFAPNFLEYINNGLDLFESDVNVLAICGAKDTDWVTDNKSVVFTKLYAAYGVGGWLKKRAEAKLEIYETLLSEKMHGPRIMGKLLGRNRCLFNSYVLGVLCSDQGFFWRGKNDLRMCDSVYSMYMHLTDKVCIAPAVAKSRTWGNDGSGENMKKQEIDPEKEWPLDVQKEFAYPSLENLRFVEENYALGDKYLSKGQGVNTVKALLAYSMFLLCGKNRKIVIRIADMVRKCKC